MTRRHCLEDLIVSVQAGFASGERADDGTLQVRMNNVTTSGELTWTDATRVPCSKAQVAKYGLEAGDILFNQTNSPALVGKTAAFEARSEPVVFSNHFLRIRVRRELIRHDYLALLLNHLRFKGVFERACTQWVNQASYRTADLLKLSVDLPTLAEQESVVDALHSVRAVSRMRQGQLDDAVLLSQAVFLEMFGDPVENPRGHAQKKLSQVSQVRGGLQVSGKREGSREVAYLRVANVYRDTLKLDEIKTMRVSDAELTRTKLESGDVLVVEGHGNPEELGRSAVWRAELPEMIHQNHLIRIRPDSTLVTSEFVSAYINSEAGRRQMLQAGKTTSGLNTISTTQVANLDVLVPPMPLQRRFVEALDEVRKLKETLKRSLAETEALYASLSDRYFGAP